MKQDLSKNVIHMIAGLSFVISNDTCNIGL